MIMAMINIGSMGMFMFDSLVECGGGSLRHCQKIHDCHDCDDDVHRCRYINYKYKLPKGSARVGI